MFKRPLEALVLLEFVFENHKISLAHLAKIKPNETFYV